MPAKSNLDCTTLFHQNLQKATETKKQLDYLQKELNLSGCKMSYNEGWVYPIFTCETSYNEGLV